MLSELDFAAWAKRIGFSDQAQSAIAHIRRCEPARRAGGGRANLSQCEEILAESREGETRLNDSEDSELCFRTLLGIEPQAGSRNAQAAPVPTMPPNRKHARVGQRSPRRDPIQGEGVAAYA